MPSDQSTTIEVIVRILCDTQPERMFDGVHLFAQTSDNADSVLLAGANVWHNGLSRKLLVLNTTPSGGYDGYKVWRKRLTTLSVPDSGIEKIALNSREHNTLTEAQALVQHARQKAFTAIGIIAPPFHLPRAFMTTVRAARDILPQLKIYSIAGISQPWNGTVVHSQGILNAKRVELIGEELLRITRYVAKRDVSSFEETRNYLDRRDIGNL